MNFRLSSRKLRRFHYDISREYNDVDCRLELENKQLRGQLEAERSDKLERSSSGYFGYDRGYDSDILGNTGSNAFGKRRFGWQTVSRYWMKTLM